MNEPTGNTPEEDTAALRAKLMREGCCSAEDADKIIAARHAQTAPPADNAHIAPGCELFEPREIVDHKLNGLNDAIKILVLDAPGSGGANHRYRLELNVDHELGPKMLWINFQNGPIKEAGFNGFTNEALLAVLIDRMRGFQTGPYKNEDNAMALSHLESALEKLQHRTRERLARGVEGTHSL